MCVYLRGYLEIPTYIAYVCTANPPRSKETKQFSALCVRRKTKPGVAEQLLQAKAKVKAAAQVSCMQAF